MKRATTPIKLTKEPLIDVVCGVGLNCSQPIDTFIPGLLLKKLDGKQPIFEALPAARLPAEFRAANLPLQNIPLMRVVIDSQFVALIGQKWLGVGCQMPYAGWENFRAMIETIFSALLDAPFIESVDRYSLKYTDFLPKRDDRESLDSFDLSISIAGRALRSELTQLRTEIQDNQFIHAVTIISQAKLNRLGPNAHAAEEIVSEGALIDVDTHRNNAASPVGEFIENLRSSLDEIHLANKNFFFQLLSESGLSDLEPQYD